MTKITDQVFDTPMNLRQSFLVLVAFLEQFNSRGPVPTDELLSWLQFHSDGSTFDPAQLDDFLLSAKSVLQLGD